MKNKDPNKPIKTHQKEDKHPGNKIKTKAEKHQATPNNKKI